MIALDYGRIGPSCSSEAGGESPSDLVLPVAVAAAVVVVVVGFAAAAAAAAAVAAVVFHRSLVSEEDSARAAIRVNRSVRRGMAPRSDLELAEDTRRPTSMAKGRNVEKDRKSADATDYYSVATCSVVGGGGYGGEGVENVGCVVRPLRRCTVLRQGFAQYLVLHLFTCPCRMQIYLACTMLDNERYESRAVNDRLNECEAQARFAKQCKRLPPDIFWGQGWMEFS